MWAMVIPFMWNRLEILKGYLLSFCTVGRVAGAALRCGGILTLMFIALCCSTSAVAGGRDHMRALSTIRRGIWWRILN